MQLLNTVWLTPATMASALLLRKSMAQFYMLRKYALKVAWRFSRPIFLPTENCGISDFGYGAISNNKTRRIFETTVLRNIEQIYRFLTRLDQSTLDKALKDLWEVAAGNLKCLIEDAFDPPQHEERSSTVRNELLPEIRMSAHNNNIWAYWTAAASTKKTKRQVLNS